MRRPSISMKLRGQERRECERVGARRRVRAFIQCMESVEKKKSIFNLAVRMAKLACQQCYHGLNYTKLPLRKGKMRG